MKYQKLDLSLVRRKTIPISWVDVDWALRVGDRAGNWTVYDTHVRSDIAQRLVTRLNKTDRLFAYRITNERIK